MPWIVAYTVAQSEDLAAEHLGRIGEVFNPKLRIGDKLKPLFPRYVLVAPENLRAAYSARGVSRIIGQPGPPSTIKEEIVAELRSRCDADGILLQDHNDHTERRVTHGDFCKVTEGPFAGFSGLCRKTDAQRVTLLLSMFGRSSEVSVLRTSVALV